jgi:hypothetical protein
MKKGGLFAGERCAMELGVLDGADLEVGTDLV